MSSTSFGTYAYARLRDSMSLSSSSLARFVLTCFSTCLLGSVFAFFFSFFPWLLPSVVTGRRCPCPSSLSFFFRSALGACRALPCLAMRCPLRARRTRQFARGALAVRDRLRDRGRALPARQGHVPGHRPAPRRAQVGVYKRVRERRSERTSERAVARLACLARGRRGACMHTRTFTASLVLRFPHPHKTPP